MKVLADPVAWLWFCSLLGGVVLFNRRFRIPESISTEDTVQNFNAPSLPRSNCWFRNLRWLLLGLALIASVGQMFNIPARLLASLERPYLVDASKNATAVDAVLVLGGYGVAFPNHSVGLDLNEAGDRIITGVSLVREGKGQVLVLSGGGQGTPPEPLEAQAAKSWITSWKLVPNPVEILGPSANTHDEAIRMTTLARQKGWDKIILVSSAWHLRRALPVFNKTGLQVIPVGADFQGSVVLLQPQRLPLVPRTSSLVLFKLWLEEIMGYEYYRLRGWV